VLGPRNERCWALETNGVGPSKRTVLGPRNERCWALETNGFQAYQQNPTEPTGAYATAKSGSVVFGRNGAGARWTFPAGDTTPGVDEVLVLFNPSAVTVPVTATFYDSTGKTVTRQLTIAPTAHAAIAVNTLGLAPQHSAVLQSGNGQGFIAEQGITTVDARLFRSTQGIAQ